MQTLVSHLVSGLQLGVLYAVVTIGYNLLILVTGVLHFGYAHAVVLSMYMAWLVLAATGENVWLGILAAVVSGTVINAALTPLFLPFIKRRAYLEAMVISIGLSLIMVEVMSHWINLGLPIAFPPGFQLSGSAVQIGLARVSAGRLLSLLVGIGAVYGFFSFLYRTKRGLVLRAMAQSPDVASVLGISVPKTALLSFALSGVLAGVVAVLFTVSIGTASAQMADNVALVCMAILFLAGIGNLKGGLVCSLLIGVVEALVMAFLPGDWTKALAFVVILLVLLFKPEGLFGMQH